MEGAAQRTIPGSAGFTLLEIMLATLVLAVVVSMVSLSLSGSMRAIEATRDQGEIYYPAQVALERISDDLQSAMLPPDVDFIGIQGGELDEDTVLLTFASMAHVVFDPQQEQQGPGIIGYELRPDPQEDQQRILLRSDVLYRPTNGEERRRGDMEAFLLCDRLRSVRFAFVGPDGEPLEEWSTVARNEEDKKKRRLPAAVTCTLEFWLDPEEDTSLTFETTVVLPVGRIQPEKEDGDAG
jgi:general secretion pathway protein J